MLDNFLEYLKCNLSREEYNRLVIISNDKLVLTKDICSLLSKYINNKSNDIVFSPKDFLFLIGEDIPNSPNYYEEIFGDLDDLIACHISPVPIKDDTIVTKENGGVTGSIYFRDPYDLTEHKVVYPNGNDTTHFTLNCPVENHSVGNDWDSYKYGVVLKFKKLNKDKVLDSKGEDTYLDGDVLLGDEYYLLCPKGEKDLLQKDNPNTTIIEYDGIRLSDAIKCLILFNGKKLEPYGTYSWGRNSEYERDSIDTLKLERLMIKEGYPYLKGQFGNALHSETKYMARRMWKREYEALLNLVEYNKENNIDMPDDVIFNVLLYNGCYSIPGVLKVTIDYYKEFVIPILEKHKIVVDDSLFEGLEELESDNDFKIIDTNTGTVPFVRCPVWEDELRKRIIKLVKEHLYNKNNIK